MFASPSVGLGSSPGSAPRQLLPSSPSPNSNPLAEAVAEGPSAEDQGMARRQLPLLGKATGQAPRRRGAAARETGAAAGGAASSTSIALETIRQVRQLACARRALLKGERCGARLYCPLHARARLAERHRETYPFSVCVAED